MCGSPGVHVSWRLYASHLRSCHSYISQEEVTVPPSPTPVCVCVSTTSMPDAFVEHCDRKCHVTQLKGKVDNVVSGKGTAAGRSVLTPSFPFGCLVCCLMKLSDIQVLSSSWISLFVHVK